MKKKIVVVGSLNMDMTLSVDHIPAVGETTISKTVEFRPGGKGANQAYAAGALEGYVSMLGYVGRDDNGKKMLDSLAKSGVDISRIRMLENEDTGMAVINVDGEGNNNIIVYQGANCKVDSTYILENKDLFSEGTLVLISMEIPYETVYMTIRLAKQNGCVVILNPAPAPEPEEIPKDIWEMIDYLTPNETEVVRLAKMKGLEQEKVLGASQKVFGYGVKNVLATLGEQGAALINQGGLQRFPSRKVYACDTTAAGDCFNGALAVALSEGEKLERAIDFANTAASIAVTRKGAQCSLPNRKEVNDTERREERYA